MSHSAKKAAILLSLLLGTTLMGAQLKRGQLRADKKALWSTHVGTPELRRYPDCNWEMLYDTPKIATLANGQVATFSEYRCYTHAGVGAWSSIEHAQYVLKVLDPESGTVVAERTFDALPSQPSDRIALEATEKGMMLSFGGALHFIDFDLHEVTVHRLPPQSGRWFVGTSPDGKRVFLHGTQPRQSHWIDLRDFTEGRLFTVPSNSGFAIASDRIYHYPESGYVPATIRTANPELLKQAAMRVYDQALNSDRALCDDCIGWPELVLKNGLLVAGTRVDTRREVTLTLFDAEGKRRLEWQPHGSAHAEQVWRAVGARGSNIFAFGYGLRESKDDIVVIDGDSLKETNHLKIKWSWYRDGPMDSFPGYELALSEDGSKLFVAYGEQVYCFRLAK